jgi:hypothetical protein
LAVVFLYEEHTSKQPIMKKSICLAASLLALNLTPVFGQQAPGQNPPVPTFLPGHYPSRPIMSAPEAPALTKFNLDFPGGTPKELVTAIEKAMGKPLNAIIPKEDEDLQMPPLKMNDVVVSQLFAALKAASRKEVAVSTGMFGSSYSTFIGDYGFETADSPLSDTSIWYFRAEKPTLPPVVSTAKITKFYSLDDYLNRGFSVDDITTAIQTGWKMAGDTSPPELSYHKETKMLIAFGEPYKLQTIQEVLGALPATKVYLGDVQDLRSKVSMLQKQIWDLQIKVSASTTNSAPEEKSGK